MKIVVFDFETHLFRPGFLTPRPVCMSWAQGTQSGLVTRDDARPLLVKWLSDPNVTLYAHNTTFDVGVALNEWPDLWSLFRDAYDADRVLDTMVRQALLDIYGGEMKERDGAPTVRSLAALSKLWLNKELPKVDTWRLRYSELDGVPISQYPAAASDYAIRDAITTLAVWKAQENWIIHASDSPDDRIVTIAEEARQCRSALWLHLCSSWGVRTDGKMVRKVKDELTTESTRLKDLAKANGLVRLDGTKDLKTIRECVEIKYTALGLRIPTTVGGHTSTSAETFSGSNVPELKRLAELAAVDKVLRTYVPAIEQGVNGPICARYNVLVETGRTSCSQPNLQNPPRSGGIRETFVPRPNFLYAFCDYDSIELRALAQVCWDELGKSRLRKILNTGEDPHLWLAAMLLRIDYNEAKRRYDDGDEEVEKTRQISKIANFGFPGGLGPDTFVTYAKGRGAGHLVPDAKRAAELRDAWFAAWPEMKAYFALISDRTNGGYGTIIQLKSGRLRGKCTFCQAANTLFQGLTADGAKAAGWRILKECMEPFDPGPLGGSRTVLFLHDEFGLEVPDPAGRPEVAHAAAERLSLVMCEEMQKWIPDVPITASAVLTRRWFKGAKPVRVDGFLRPSRPVKADGKTKWVYDEGATP
jgi:DNA polymerase-1